ncbi:type II secretion system protein [Candidatus Parcubacteria bacterium]|jgi:type II secretory pathway pseudopilin PulG|nr:type II secretion system protein [Candidatus Parcubacteria bacterium]MBT7228417.1 type II secretion system protein [Candidatus Parcubacteria bacterium]
MNIISDKNKKLAQGQAFSKKSATGFTLVEILLSISIFLIMTTSVMAIYIAFSKMQVRTLVAQQVINDSQFAMEVMAREIRNGEILLYSPDADDCNDIMSPTKRRYQECVILKRSDGSLISFGRDPSTYGLYYQVPDCNDDYSVCQETKNDPRANLMLLGVWLNDIDVEEIDFVIDPSSSPFVDDAATNLQPKVTIRMKVAYAGEKNAQSVSYVFQTTISTRVYRR